MREDCRISPDTWLRQAPRALARLDNRIYFAQHLVGLCEPLADDQQFTPAFWTAFGIPRLQALERILENLRHDQPRILLLVIGGKSHFLGSVFAPAAPLPSRLPSADLVPASVGLPLRIHSNPTAIMAPIRGPAT